MSRIGWVVASAILVAGLIAAAVAIRPQVQPTLPSTIVPEDPVRSRFPAGIHLETGDPSRPDVAVHSVLKVPAAMRYGDTVWNERGAGRGPLWVRIDLRTQLMSIFRGGDEIGTAVVLYGADEKETPTGAFPILWKGRNHRSSLYDAPMPYTLRLTGDGVAIHGSNVRWGAATHGCVGIPQDFAAQLFEIARVGDLVTIIRSSAPPKT